MVALALNHWICFFSIQTDKPDRHVLFPLKIQLIFETNPSAQIRRTVMDLLSCTEYYKMNYIE